MKWLIFEWLISLSLFGLLARLVSVQLVDHDYYQALARDNRIKLEVIPADRGVIFDRFQVPLNRNAPEGRAYGLSEAGSGVLGYVGQGDREIVGKDGLERAYDWKLKGKPGGRLLETDSAGELIREIGQSDPVAGDNLVSTLDAGLQQKAYSLLSGRKGAVVVSDPENGEILALVSSPGFKPEQVEEYLNDANLPLFNRAIGGEYPPGSTFKLITAAAALEERKADATTQIEDTGEIQIGSYRFGNWYYNQYGRTEGSLDLLKALKRSNDIFFYRLGERLGIRALADWARFFGVGSLSGVDLPGEAAGLMPDPDWKQAQKKEDWFLGDTLITAIGQGDILMTPLQVNQMASVFAAKGRWCRPHLVIEDKSGYCRRLDIQPGTIELITSGMVQVTQTGGTAFPFFDFEVNGKTINVAGKTGTAEFGPESTKPAEMQTHAWFTGFAPVPDPNIVVTVLLEAAGEGSYQAAPVAKDLLAYWFSRQ